jgi:EAL domain-containing protein (putative c-di-GMP-specific phosphodiesterase class I)
MDGRDEGRQLATLRGSRPRISRCINTLVPVDYFKIDGDFIRGFGANTTDQLVVEAIVGIAKGMGKKTVAEFVTDQEMTDRLRRSGIDYAQGFHIGPPKPIIEAFGQQMSVGSRWSSKD